MLKSNEDPITIDSSFVKTDGIIFRIAAQFDDVMKKIQSVDIANYLRNDLFIKIHILPWDNIDPMSGNNAAKYNLYFTEWNTFIKKLVINQCDSRRQQTENIDEF